MKDNLVNSVVSFSNLIIDYEIEFSVDPSCHFLLSLCITSKRIYSKYRLWGEALVCFIVAKCFTPRPLSSKEIKF